MIQLDKKYDPKTVEIKWNQYWEENGFSRADEHFAAEAFCMVIPPPNITGSLHIGHAFNNTLQDILIRWKRMLGFNTLWQPGTDHAGIATQNVVERQLRAEGTDRCELGREEFIKRVWKWKEESGGNITRQLVKLGGSMDWRRNRFTMDQGLSQAVREVFVSLYEEGLIYKGDYIVNWCPRCRTALSDLEVEYQETQGHLYHIKYHFKEQPEFLTIATTRPETLLGDTAVAVNPKDQRYQSLKGKSLVLPILNREIPLIEDDHVDVTFGTGALKVTPAHDPNDFEIGRRHNLPRIKVMNEDGTMNENAGPYKGKERFHCRKEIVEELKTKGLLPKVEDLQHSVGHCYRCRTVIEPYLSKQWFVKIKPLARPAIDAVKSGKIQIAPQFWENTYFEWMENIRDWCISRQIWWGHQIPAWTCCHTDCRKIIVSRETPQKCPQCGRPDLEQETDVLDTWFSSALWPFSTLGWPEKTKSLERYYPTSVLVTGFDILFFWVARMIMMGLRFMGDVPFRRVYIHALVRDAEGQKMSKTKGNVIDPLEVMEHYGTDALRFTLAAFAAQGRDIKLAEDRIEGYRNFCNKLWNASRFVFMNLEDYRGTAKLDPRAEHDLVDRWILSRLNEASLGVTRGLEDFKFNEAASTVYKFIWREFCDWYIELSKSRLLSGGEAREATQNILVYVLESWLKLLHPFMPFITEEIWQKLPAEGKSIMLAPFPKFDPVWQDEDAENKLGLIMDVITGVRNIRGEMNFNPGLLLNLLIKTDDREKAATLDKYSGYIKELAKVSDVEAGPFVTKPHAAASLILNGMDIIIPLEGMIDFDEEKKRVQKELKKVEKDILFLGKKLANPNFFEKAPANVIEKDKQKKLALTEKHAKLLSHLVVIEQG
ncbi:MAG: valine--tRNA ligase [Nitrospinota bacterium]|nr:valine--tRNA ligase [Nitrospinota bacterium]